MDGQAYVECGFPSPWNEHFQAPGCQTSLSSKQQSSLDRGHEHGKHYYKYPDQSRGKRERERDP